MLVCGSQTNALNSIIEDIFPQKLDAILDLLRRMASLM
jgi:hypothetical protein